jgi:hypothetical protein
MATVDDDPTPNSASRLVVALVVAALMWVAAVVAVAVALVAPLMNDDGLRRSELRGVFAVASVAAIALFLGSGPVAYWIGRRRWLLALPLIGLVVWVMGIGIAQRF